MINDVRKKYPNNFDFDLEKLTAGEYVAKEGKYLKYIRDNMPGLEVVCK